MFFKLKHELQLMQIQIQWNTVCTFV